MFLLSVSKITLKYGKVEGVRPCKCTSCGTQFLITYQSHGHADLIWQKYISGNQTYLKLAAEYECPAKTIQRKTDTAQAERQITFCSVANVLMGTAYFRRKPGHFAGLKNKLRNHNELSPARKKKFTDEFLKA